MNANEGVNKGKNSLKQAISSSHSKLIVPKSHFSKISKSCKNRNGKPSE